MISEPRRTPAQVNAVRDQVDLEEQVRLDECEILEFLRVAKEFPEFFRPAPDRQISPHTPLSPRVAGIYYG